LHNINDISNLVLSCLLSAHEDRDTNLDLLMNSGISKEWFSDEVHKQVFEVINICYKAGTPFNADTIIEYLTRAKISNPQNIVLNIIAQRAVPQSIALENIKFLKESYHKTMLNTLSLNISTMLNEPNANTEAITQMVQNGLDDFAFLNSLGHTKTLTRVRENRKAQPPATRLKTEIPFIDTVLTDKYGNKGIRNEGLFFISGLKQSGKTFILTRIIENISKTHPVMFGSMEFGEDLYDETVEEAQEDGFWDGNPDNIYMFDSIYSVDAIIAEIRFQHKLNGIRLVALDSMMRMSNLNPELKTDERRISEMFSKLGKLSKELKIPIIIIVQTSKEDMKSSMVSVKGSMNADHEAYVWFHITKSKPKVDDDEMRTVLWTKNKDTRKHPKQHLMFVPQTSDFYRVEIDENGNVVKPLDKFRKPPARVVETTYETISKDEQPIVGEMPAMF